MSEKQHCPCCGLAMDTIFQESRFHPDGGYSLHTCWNKACKLYQYTLKDLSAENLLRYGVTEEDTRR